MGIRTRALKGTSGTGPEHGFTLMEMAIAMLVLVVGLIAVAQLVPTAMLSNLRNRYDSSATVYAQRELQQMLDQPLAATSLTDADGHVCQLGDSGSPNTVVGSPVVMFGAMTRIDFTAAPVPGYSFNYVDLNDPSGATYDIRWAVITNAQNAVVISKRFIIGAQKRGGDGVLAPVTLDAWVQR